MMTIRQKLTSAIAVTIAAILVMGGLAFWIELAFEDQESVLSQHHEKFGLVSELQLKITSLLMPANDYIITGKAEFRKEFEEQRQAVETLLARIGRNTEFTASEKEILGRVRDLLGHITRLSLQILDRPHDSPGQGELMEQMDYHYAAPAVESMNGFRESVQKGIEASQAEMTRLKRIFKFLIALVLLGVLLGCGAFGISLYRSIHRPLRESVEMLTRLSAGEFSGRLPDTSRDEFGILASSVNQMSENMAAMIRNIQEAVVDLNAISRSMADASRDVVGSSSVQTEATERVSIAVRQMVVSIRAVAADADRLERFAESVDHSSDSVQVAMSSLSGHADELERATKTSRSAMGTVSDIFSTINRDLQSLFQQTESAATSIQEILWGIKEVARHTGEQTALSVHMKEEMAGVALAAMDETRNGINRIRKETDETAAAVRRLENLSAEIGKIIIVINDITEATRLLSLNAAILAAQAGEHGRAFSVVADEIDQLASSTATSTRDIRELVRKVQNDLAATVGCTERTMKSVDEGLRLSDDAERALNQMIRGMDASIEIARRVDGAVNEQRKAVEHIDSSIQNVNENVEHIRISAEAQEKAVAEILSVSDHARTLSVNIAGATGEQARQSVQLAEEIRDAYGRIQGISRETASQSGAVTDISQTVDEVRAESQKGGRVAIEMDGLVRKLELTAGRLRSGVQRFRVS